MIAMLGEASVIAVATLAVGIVSASTLRLLPTVRLQLTGLALLAALLPLAAVLASGLVVLHMDGLKVVAVSAGAAVAAVSAALVLTRWILGPLDRLRDATRELAGGDLSARAETSAPREVAEVALAFNEMAADLEQLFDARRQLVAWASHDLRTPLASMQAMLEALEDGLAEPAEYLPALREQVAVLSVLVDDLFELARLDAGVLTLELRAAQLDGLVRSCLRGVEAEARARGIRLEARVEGAVPEVRVAPEKVERVLYNLLANALRHTPADGSVAVVVEPGPAEVVVSVEDTGEGLPLGANQRVFERFWRGDPSRSRSRGGSGLGLAIAQGLVEAHGGRIWAENRPGGGARFAFTLPTTPPARAA